MNAPPAPAGGAATSKPERPVRVLVACAFVIVIALLVGATAKVLFVLFAGVLLAISLRALSVALARRAHLPIGLAVGFLAVLLVGCGSVFMVLFSPESARPSRSASASVARGAR